MRNLILAACLSACVHQSVNTFSPVYPITPEAAAKATFEIDIYDGETPLGSGTAWIVDYKEDTSYIMTAGHVCQHSLDQDLNFKLQTRENKEFVVEMKMYASDPDLCLLTYSGFIARPLQLANKMPKYASLVTYVGAPLRFWGNGAAFITDGRWTGDHYISAPTAPGASGSAVWTPEGVFGVLVTVNRNFNHLVGIETLDHIQKFLANAGL